MYVPYRHRTRDARDLEKMLRAMTTMAAGDQLHNQWWGYRLATDSWVQEWWGQVWPRMLDDAAGRRTFQRLCGHSFRLSRSLSFLPSAKEERAAKERAERRAAKERASAEEARLCTLYLPEDVALRAPGESEQDWLQGQTARQRLDCPEEVGAI